MNLDFQTITNAIGWALVHFLWQGLAIALGTAFLLQICRNARAQTRYLIACLGLVLCCLAPIWELQGSLQTTKEFISAQVVSSSFLESKAELGWIEQTQIWFQMHIDFIVISWAIVVAILGLRLSLGIFWLRSYSNGKRGVSNSYWQQRTDQLAVHFQIAKPVLVRIVNDLESPITIGWIRPMILIPASLITGMTPSYLEALIAHELAHISRFDYVVNFIQNLIEMVLFFHPAVWWISKKIRTERENIADDLAASMLGEPRRLALALQELEYIQFTTPQLAQSAHGGNLMLRIKRLVRPEAQSINWKTAVTVIGVTAACMGLVANAAVYAEKPTELIKPAMEPIFSETTNREVSAAPLLTSDNNLETKDKVKGILIPPKVPFEKIECRPEYPKSELKKGSAGTTTLSVTVESDGRISKVDVSESSGFSALDNSVRDAMLAGTCIARPETLDGKAQKSEFEISYVWKSDVDKAAKSISIKEAVNSDPIVNFKKSGCTPNYPRVSMRNEETGTTELDVAVSETGKINEVKVSKSSGFRGLDAAVRDQLLAGSCKATPGMKDGNPIASETKVTYVWKLD